MHPPMNIRRLPGTWVVRAGGAVIAETDRALGLTEGDHPEVIYFPREDVAMAFLEPTDTVTTCPHKGEARHYTIVTKSRRLENAAWSYEDPLPDVAEIKEYLAFYPADTVTVEQL